MRRMVQQAVSAGGAAAASSRRLSAAPGVFGRFRVFGMVNQVNLNETMVIFAALRRRAGFATPDALLRELRLTCP